MNKDAGQSAWSNAQQEYPGGDDDFSAFLELGDFGLDLGNFDMGVDPQNELHESILAGGFSGVDLDISNNMNVQTNGVLRGSEKSAPNNLLQLPQGSMSEPELCLMDFNPSAAQLQMGQYHQQHFVTGGYIPPTPSSMELQAGLQSTSGYMNHTPFMERYQNLQEDQMVFTPLVSPAVTPFDSSFINLPEFATMGAYFSPINSPALEAQHTSRGHSRRISSSTSPIEPKDLSSSLAKKSLRRKSATLRNPARVVRESPNMKPVRRKAPPALITTAEAIEPVKEASEETLASQTPRRTLSRRMPGLSGSSSREGSSTDSISPEPLSEALMPPPPAPVVGHKLSHLSTSDQMDVDSVSKDATSDARSLAPATPASLMNIAKAKLAEKTEALNNSTNGFLTNDIIAGFATKSKDHEAAIINSVVEEIEQTLPEDEQSTPTLLSVRPATKAKRPLDKDDEISPQIEPLASTTTKSNKASPGSIGKKDSKSKLHSKRSSVHISPAIQPKISPHIKPLLPDGMTSSATAHLLASRSNYENIVSGTHNQLGLSYPAHMSTDLTSKRTSHKLAEQGRRDRMNNAIAEIASLLPANSAKLVGEGDREAAAEKENGNSAAAQSSSKASTVEMAIDYIKELQQQLEQMKGKLSTVEAELQVYKGMNRDLEKREA